MARKIATIAVGVFFLLSTSAQAEWVDDWLQQRSTSGPNYFHGQERGYYQAGSFSTRWSNTNEYPLTIEAPRIKSGCGGIDVFLGGMSFMNTDYLVDKLQGILSGAAAVAFDLGLKALCSQCSNTIKNFEAIADNLNSMQIEECAAAKGLVGMVMDENGVHSSEVAREKLGTAIKENKLVQGVSEMWHMATEEDQANNNVPQAADVTRINSGCNADIRNIFLSGGSMLDNLGSAMGIPTAHTELIRGLVGDVTLEGPASAYKVAYEVPCPQNNPDDIKGISEGILYSKASGGTCSQIADTNRDLVQYVTNILDGIATKVESKGVLTTDEQDFLESTPLSPLPIIKTAIGSNQKETMISNLANITAKAYSLQMLSDLYIRAEAIGVKANEMLEKKAGGASGGAPAENCNPAVFAGQISGDIGIMLDKVRQLQEASREAYVAAAGEITTIMSYMEKMQKIETQMVSEITRRYGKDMASRMQL